MFADLKVSDLEKLLKSDVFSPSVYESYLKLCSLMQEIARACAPILKEADQVDGENDKE